jgi:hypothetical protein
MNRRVTTKVLNARALDLWENYHQSTAMSNMEEWSREQRARSIEVSPRSKTSTLDLTTPRFALDRTSNSLGSTDTFAANEVLGQTSISAVYNVRTRFPFKD